MLMLTASAYQGRLSAELWISLSPQYSFRAQSVQPMWGRLSTELCMPEDLFVTMFSYGVIAKKLNLTLTFGSESLRDTRPTPGHLPTSLKKSAQPFREEFLTQKRTHTQHTHTHTTHPHTHTRTPFDPSLRDEHRYPTMGYPESRYSGTPIVTMATVAMVNWEGRE